jgi:hypothetical protein
LQTKQIDRTFQMIEIFKTNLENQADANFILQQLKTFFTNYFCNFDLEDCNKILRIEASNIDIAKIEETLCKMGFDCENLD